MANVEKLQEHLKKAKSKLAEASGDTVETRKLKKKTKRLARKSNKITATEKMAELTGGLQLPPGFQMPF